MCMGTHTHTHTTHKTLEIREDKNSAECWSGEEGEEGGEEGSDAGRFCLPGCGERLQAREGVTCMENARQLQTRTHGAADTLANLRTQITRTAERWEKGKAVPRQRAIDSSAPNPPGNSRSSSSSKMR